MSGYNIAEGCLGIICPYCGAGIGEHCRTVSGNRAPISHAGRFEPIARAYGAGYGEGREDEQSRRERASR